jgi:hypothetical protein
VQQQDEISGVSKKFGEWYQKKKQKLYERYQQCVVKDGDYFEGQ